MFLWNRGQTFAELELRNSFPICSLLRQWFRILRSPQERNWEPYPETRSKQFASRSGLSCGQSSAGFRLLPDTEGTLPIQCVGQFASRLLGPRSFNKSPAFSNGNPTDLDGALSLPVACFSRERCTRWLRCIGAEFLTSGPTMCAASLLNLLGTLSLTMRATIASRPSCRRK